MNEIVPSDAVKAIQDSVRTDLIHVDGEQYTTRPVFSPPSEGLPETLVVHTLNGLVQFLARENRPRIELIHVKNPGQVYVYGAIEGRNQKRPCYLAAEMFGSKSFPFDSWQDQEMFVICAQTSFVASNERAKLLAFAGNIIDEAVSNQADDGVSQKVSTRKGVSLVGAEKAPNPIRLQPYRTFPEVDQPASDYIFRLRKKDGVEMALFKTADNRWELEAINSIKDYLEVMFAAGGITGIPIIS